VAILRADWADRPLVLCDGYLVVVGLPGLAPQQCDEEWCCESHCYERESELFKHLISPGCRECERLGR
jgi:hypothetical protein